MARRGCPVLKGLEGGVSFGVKPLFHSVSHLTVNPACSFPAILWSLPWSIAAGPYALFVPTSVGFAIYFILFCYLFTIAASMIYRRILFEILPLRYPTLATCTSPTELMAHLELVMSPFLPAPPASASHVPQLSLVMWLPG